MNFKRSTTSMAIALLAVSLISVTSIQQDAFAQTQGMTLTAMADAGSKTITVTGKTVSGYTDVAFTVKSPSGNNVVAIGQTTQMLKECLVQNSILVQHGLRMDSMKSKHNKVTQHCIQW